MRLEYVQGEIMCKFTKFLKLIISFALFMLFVQSNSFADLDITKNKEFIMTFLPNYHNNWNTPDRRGDSIYIFIYAAVPTTGKIVYKDIYGVDYTENFSIPDPKVVYVFKRPAYDYALLGYNVSGNISNQTHSEKFVYLSFKISADMPIQVYGHSQAVTTSESFNVLPIESLGNEYLVLAYNANTDTGPGNPDGRTPSQFAVIAVEDSTEVTITPSVATMYNDIDVQNIVLRAGQVYLVQSSLFEDNPDLSRTHIKSNKPIAVFSGQQRARVPHGADGTSVSRDYLAEQMPPIDSWSNEAIVVPFPKPTNLESSNVYYDKLRIIAAYDNTELYVGGVLLTILDRAEIYEANLITPQHIIANAPIMAAGYKRSSQINDQNNNFRGDPLLQIIPTPNQYGESYRFITIQAYEDFQGVYDEHYITIISEPANVPTLLLDNTPLNPTIFKPVNGSNYRYAQIRIGEGTHQIIGERPFGLFVCGYGYANSYGYFCGVVAKRDDYEPPELQSSTDCFEVEGVFTDQKLKSITAPANLVQNVAVNIESFTPYVKEAKFSANLVNEYLDGSFRITGIDSVGQQTSKDFEIPGFTVTLMSELANEDKNIKQLRDSMGVGERKCYKYTLYNYGKFNQTVNIARLIQNHPELTIDLPATFEIAKGAKLDFEICFLSDKVTNVLDSLFIKSDCGERYLLSLDLLSSKDENMPQVSSFNDPCNQFIELSVTDSLRTDIGIDTIIIVQLENLDVEIRKISEKSYIVIAKVMSRDKDSFISLIAKDKQGNFTTYEKSLPGFTIEFSEIDFIDDSTMKIDFGNKIIGIRYCDSVRLTNYGKYEIIFDNPRLSDNVRFSLPPSQLPVIIKPGAYVDVKLCYFANKSGLEIMTDTLNMRYNCIDKNIVLMGKPDSMIFTGDSRCDIPLLFEVSEVPNGAFVGSGYPNPSGGIINIDFNHPERSNVSIIIYNQIGTVVKSIEYKNLERGYYKVPADLGSVQNGYYNILITIGSERFYRNIIVLK